jgi:hypothetical protein
MLGHQRLLFAFLAIGGGLLAGCAGTTLDAAPVSGEPIKSEAVSDILSHAEDLRSKYKERRDSLYRVRHYFDLPIIGLAVASVGSLFYKGSRDLTAGLGIAAGGIAAARGYEDPGGRADGYHKGVAALTCIIEEGQKFQNSAARDRARQLKETLLPGLRDTIAEASRALTQPMAISGVNVTSDQVSRFTAAQDDVRKALTASQQVLKAATDELASSEDGPSALRSAIRRVDDQVAALVTRQSITFADATSTVLGALQRTADLTSAVSGARQGLGTVPTTAARAQPQQQLPPIEAQIVELKQIAANLALQTEAVLLELPGFVKAQAEVAKCAIKT